MGDAVGDGSADRDGADEALGADADGDGDSGAPAPAEADTEGPGDPEADGGAEGALGSVSGVASVDDGSGTPARTSSGAAPSRDGVSYENSPLAKPAAPSTTATVPAALSRTPLRRLRGFLAPPVPPSLPPPVSSVRAVTAGRGAVAEVSNRRRSRALGEPAEGARGFGSEGSDPVPDSGPGSASAAAAPGGAPASTARRVMVASASAAGASVAGAGASGAASAGSGVPGAPGGP
ncbi:hypothetical protein [Streptomyces sp. FXJ7.023]|uniref:hypothetical protein n=1 Tax=Streptomyces sp. FXJ7.023 TaxID=579932 RepID=UPI000567C09B|nr:hypothetical protein [Streptomyces sp. FXJ7.023]